MKKSLVTLALAFAFAGIVLSATLPACGQAAPSAQPGQVTIKDPAEYNAYVTATNQTDPTAKAQALEAFLQQYPNSVMKQTALELLMASYKDPQKMQDAAQRLLQTDTTNLRALALLTYLNRACSATQVPNALQCLNDAAKYGQQGLQALQTAQAPAGVTPEDFNKLKQQTAPIFSGAVGMQALQSKNYPQAAEALSQAVAANPNDLQNVYPLALAYLSQKPIDPKGLFWIAKAVNLTQGSPAQTQINNFGKASYTKYHGGDDGWQELVQQAGSQQTIPPDFKVAPAPTPAEQAAKLADTKAVKDMSFDEFELIFTSGNQAAASKVWDQIKGKPIQFESKVISVEKTRLTLAATYDDIQNSKADVELVFPVAIPVSLTPKVGEMAQVQGNPASYDPNPFMIHMTDGAFIGKKAQAAAAKGGKSTTNAPAKSSPKKKK